GSGSFAYQPDFGYLAAAAIAAEAWFALPLEVQFSFPDCLARNVEFDRRDGRGLAKEWVYFDVVAGHQPDLAGEAIAGVYHPDAVLRAGIEVGVVHAQRRVVQGFRMIPPGRAVIGPVLKPHQRRFEKCRVVLESSATHEVGLAREVADVVVKAAGPG